jgi:ParB family transcriptional regulator, chromosome partitioning protein
MGKFDERIEEFGLLVGDHETARRVEDIDLARILPDPGNPRRSFDDDELAELAASIAARGVLQPITVTPPDTQGMHRIRLGERRFRASQLAGRATIPAIVVPEGEGVQLLADQIVENDQRANLSSVELAHAIARMLKGGMNQVEIAAALGRSKQFVSLYAAYGDMPGYLKAALPRAPIRLLYDLHRTARDHPAEVEAYVASWGDAGATLAAGSRFISELKQTHPARVSPRTGVTQQKAPTERDRVRPDLVDPPSVPTPSPGLPVLVDGAPAWLPLAPLVTVIFEDGRSREVAASSISPTVEGREALPTSDPPPPRS